MNRRLRDLIDLAKREGVERVRPVPAGHNHGRLVGVVEGHEFRVIYSANAGCPRVLRNVRAQIRREVARLRNQRSNHGHA